MAKIRISGINAIMRRNAKTKISINQLPLRHYAFELSLDRLKRGIDNVRHDVHISPDFHLTANRLIFQLIIFHAEASRPFFTENRIHWHNEFSEFKRQLHAILLHGINSAKSSREIQIDVLAQTALVKLFSETIANQFEEAVQHMKTVIRKHEIAHPLEPAVALKEEISTIIAGKDRIIQKTGTDVFGCFIEVQRELNKLRISNFGNESIIPPEIFSNPILQATARTSGFFMIENYVLIGHRLEDPVNYTAFLNLLTAFLNDIRDEDPASDKAAAAPAAPASQESVIQPRIIRMSEANWPDLEGIIKHVPNMDLLFNHYKTRSALKQLKARSKSSKHRVQKLKKRAQTQKKRLRLFYRIIRRELMIEGIVAPYLMEPLLKKYCPPLQPQECLQYLIIAKTRKTITRKLIRLKRYYSRNFSLGALNLTIRQIKRTSRSHQRRYLIRFLSDFARYHRDLTNYQVIKDTADSINLRSEAKTIRLARENRTLYEFMLSHEQGEQARPIRSHAVIKADIRGSSAIIDQMKEKQQNPATSFSLNFFDPINNILGLYGAKKTFIEGDAIILSLFEHEDLPDEWYCISRACGLAINILLIVSRYNHRNRLNGLPMLDIGIGIGFAEGAPTFFYDNDSQIMISPAINKADRLSECHKSMRRRLRKNKQPFNVFRYKPATAGTPYTLPEAGMLRYNVKGIELDASGFEKLGTEIHLKRTQCRIPELSPEPLIFHTGKFPRMGGQYQRVLIREALVPEVSLNDFRILRYTDRKYYEVCTNHRAYAHVRKHV